MGPDLIVRTHLQQALSAPVLRFSALDDRQNVACRQDLQLFAVVLDFGATETAEDHVVANLDVDGDAVAVVINAAGANSQNFAFLGLFLGCIGDVET